MSMPVSTLLKSNVPFFSHAPIAPPTMAPTIPKPIIVTRPDLDLRMYCATQPAIAPTTSHAMMVTLPYLRLAFPPNGRNDAPNSRVKLGGFAKGQSPKGRISPFNTGSDG